MFIDISKSKEKPSKYVNDQNKNKKPNLYSNNNMQWYNDLQIYQTTLNHSRERKQIQNEANDLTNGAKTLTEVKKLLKCVREL